MAEKRTDLITNILAMLMLLEIAVLAGLSGYAVLTGRISREQLRLAYRVWNGEVNEQVAADAAQWKAHEAAEAQRKAQQVSGADAAAKLAATGVEAEAARLSIDRQFKDLQERERLLQMKLEEYEQTRKAVEATERRVDQKLTALREGGGQKSFQKMMGILSAMKPPEVKEVLLKMDEAMVIEILKSLDARTAAKVLAEYRTSAEVELKKRYLDAIGAGDLTAGRTAAKG